MSENEKVTGTPESKAKRRDLVTGMGMGFLISGIILLIISVRDRPLHHIAFAFIMTSFALSPRRSWRKKK